MSQADLGALIGTTSGVALRGMLTALNGALNTCNSGSSRPSYAAAGTIWLDTTGTPWIVKMYDGAADIVLGKVDASTDLFTPGALLLKGANIASAATTDLNAATGEFVHITGSVTITGFGTAPAGRTILVVFDAAPLITYNATSMILPGAASIQAAAGDSAIMVSEGSGNWRCTSYQRAARGENPGWELIDVQALSAVASYTKTGLSAFRKLRASGWARPATDAVNAGFRTDANGGASYDAGATDYGVERLSAVATTVAGAVAATSMIFLNQGSTIGNVDPESIWFTVEFFEFNQARFCTMVGHSGWFDGSTAIGYAGSTGWRSDATARDALQFLFSSGNIAIGHITLEGIRG